MSEKMLKAEDIKPLVIDLMTEAYSNISDLTRAGASDVRWGTTRIDTNTIGGANNTPELKTAKETKYNKKRATLYRGKLTQLVQATDEYTSVDDEGFKNLVLGAVKSMVKSTDIAMIHGLNPATGLKNESMLRDASIIGKSNKIKLTDPTKMSDEFVENFLKISNFNSDLLLGNKAFSDFNYALTDFGVRKYPDLSTSGNFDLYGHNTFRAGSVGARGIDEYGEDIPSNVLALAGDFSKVYRAIDTIDVKVSTDATVGGRNAFTDGFVVYKITQHYSFAVDGKFNSFVDSSYVEPETED